MSKGLSNFEEGLVFTDIKTYYKTTRAADYSYSNTKIDQGKC